MVQLAGKLGPCAYQLREERCVYAMEEVEELLRRAEERERHCEDDFLRPFLTTQRGEPICLREAKRNVDAMATQRQPIHLPPSPTLSPPLPYAPPRCWRRTHISMNECADEWAKDGFAGARRALYDSLSGLRTCLDEEGCRDLYVDVLRTTDLMERGEPVCALFAPQDKEGKPCMDSFLESIRNATRDYSAEEGKSEEDWWAVTLLFAGWYVSVWVGICAYGIPRRVERPRVVVTCSMPGEYLPS